MQKKLKITFIFLSLTTASIWLAILSFKTNNLQIIACDVGQGDAILIQNRTSQVLIDAGPDHLAVKCLDQYMPFWDRNIELVVLTHPQKDHYGGLINIFRSYKVQKLLVNGLNSGSREYQVLRNHIGGTSTEVLFSANTRDIRAGPIYLEVLHPKKDFITAYANIADGEQKDILSYFSSDLDPNEFSVVVLLKYGNFDALFTGDIDKNISDKLSDIVRMRSNAIEYLKVPHHGSKNGMSEKFLGAIKPKVAIISAGKNNRYGHPHREILEMLAKHNIKTLRTDQIGNIEIETDGDKFWID